MGTHCNIAIVLKEKDLDHKINFDWEKIKHPYNPKPEHKRLYSREENPYIYPDLYTPDPVQTPAKKGSVMMTYCQFDGYPAGVGRALLEDYNDYESALNLIVAGCLETIVWVQEDKDTYSGGFQMAPYRTTTFDMHIGTSLSRKNNEVKLQTFPSLKKVNSQQEYLYVWKDGAWWIARRCRKDEQPDVGQEILKPLTRRNTAK